MTNRLKTALLASAAALALTGSADARNVYDAHGTLFGQMIDQNNVSAIINNIVYDVEVYHNRLIASASFYFASRDCTGHPVLPYWLIGIPNEDGLLRTAWYQAVKGPFSAGNLFWDVDARRLEQMTPVGSLWTQELDAATGVVSALCEALTGNESILAQPAVPLIYTITPPFTVK